MKFALALATFALATASALLAQEQPAANPPRLRVPAPAPGDAAAAPAPAPAAAPEVETTLLPEEVPQVPKPAAQKSEPKSKTEQSAEDLAERIHFREARIKALRDPQIQTEWDRAHKAKTDFEKRAALKAYYKLLYARIVKLDGSLKKLAELREKSSVHRLEQTRIDPTEPLDPDERAERFERAAEQ